jgi:plasmid maintenance system antidote protein VapI
MGYRRINLEKRFPPNRIAEIVNNRRRITADTAFRLSLYFGNSPEFWMNLPLRCQNGAQRPKGGEKLAEARLGTMRKICQAPSAKPTSL